MKKFIYFIKYELYAGSVVGMAIFALIAMSLFAGTLAIIALATIHIGDILIIPIMLVSFVLYNYWTQYSIIKIKDIIAMIDVDQAPVCVYGSAVSEDGDIQSWVSRVGYNLDSFDCWSEEFGRRMHKHAIYSWLCTDTDVGVFVYCLDKKPVAISFQGSRKSVVDFYFLGEEELSYVRNVVMEYKNEEHHCFVDSNEDIPDAWSTHAVGKNSFNIENKQ